MTKVPKAALLCQPSPRIAELSRYKVYIPQELTLRADEDWQGWKPDPKAVDRIPYATSRIMNLAQPKALSGFYEPPRPCIWDVTREAQNCVPTERTLKLARPKNRHPEGEDYDPRTYIVSRSALLARASPRINELATPIPRKVRAKK